MDDSYSSVVEAFREESSASRLVDGTKAAVVEAFREEKNPFRLVYDT